MKRICNWNCIENMNFHMQSSTVQLYLSSISKRTFCAKIEQSLGNSFQSNSKLHMVLFFLSSKLLLENKMVNTHENSSWQKKLNKLWTRLPRSLQFPRNSSVLPTLPVSWVYFGNWHFEISKRFIFWSSIIHNSCSRLQGLGK